MDKHGRIMKVYKLTFNLVIVSVYGRNMIEELSVIKRKKELELYEENCFF
jgi:hypothetical protein